MDALKEYLPVLLPVIIIELALAVTALVHVLRHPHYKQGAVGHRRALHTDYRPGCIFRVRTGGFIDEYIRSPGNQKTLWTE